MFYGTSLMADEVEDKTITYLFTRPIPRGAVLLGKYLAYLVCTIFVVLPAVVIVWLLLVPLKGSLGASVGDLAKDLGVLALGLAVYGAVFALIGAALKRPLLVGLIFVIGWETLAMALPGNLKRLTVAFYIQGLVPHAMPNDSPISLSGAVPADAQPDRKPVLDGRQSRWFACGWRPGRWRGGKLTCSSSNDGVPGRIASANPGPGTPEPRNPIFV